MRKSIVTLSAISLISIAGCDNAPSEIRLVAPASPIDRSIAEDLSSLLDGDSPVRIVLTDSALAGEAALEAIATGAADIALVSNNLPFRNDVATVMPLYPTVLHIARRSDDKRPSSPEIFRNATIFAGFEGSASRLVFERFIARTGIAAGEFQFADDPDVAPDIAIVFAPISPTRIAKFSGYRLYSMGSPQDIGSGGIVDAAVLLNPHFRPFVIPVGTYGELTKEPVVTIAVDKILVARADLDSTVVYDLINEILRLRPALAAKRPGLFQQLSDDFDTSRSTYIVHSGTQAYLQRTAPTIYERYSGVAEVVVTLIVALGSALIAGVRIFNMRRKNRIDGFYSKTIALGRSVTATSSAEEQERVLQEVRDLQNTAFDLLVNEKLAADESFRIYVTLSNDVMRRLGASEPDMSDI